MNRLEWYRHLRSGWEPMKASHAWTQALIHDGKTIEELEAQPQFDFGKIDRLVIANYAKVCWNNMRPALYPTLKKFMEKR